MLQSDHRRWAAAKSLRRGGKPHEQHEFVSQLTSEHARIDREAREKLDELDKMIRFMEAPIAKLKDDFKVAPPEGYKAVAFFDTDEVFLSYVNEDTDDMIEIYVWPFTTDTIWPDDARALGFEVVN